MESRYAGMKLRTITLVIQAAHGQIDSSSRHPARLAGSHEDRHVRRLRERHKPSRVGPACEQLLELFPGHSICFGARLEGFLERVSLGMPCGRRPTRECPEVRARRIDLE